MLTRIAWQYGFFFTLLSDQFHQDIMSDKLFSEEEIQKIIKRAAQLQKEEQEQSSKAEKGLTMDELMKIGESSGLDMQHIKVAAIEYSEQKVTRHSGLTDTHIFEEREIETTTHEDVIWDEVRAELRHNLGVGDMFGEIKEHPTQKEWSHRSLSGIETVASLSNRSNGVKLRISQRVGLASSLTEGVMYGGVLSLIGFAFGYAFLDPSFYQGTALFASLLVVFSILVYTLDVAWRKKKLKGLAEMVDKIADQIPLAKKDGVKDSKPEIEIEDASVYATDNEKNSTKEDGLKS